MPATPNPPHSKPLPSSPAAASCHTFGSPPVLAHSGGGGGARALRFLRAPPASCVNWVLEHDPIPRAMLTADPYLTAARKAVPGLSALLALRGAVLGEGSALSSGRFLYEALGETMLLRWSSKGGVWGLTLNQSRSETVGCGVLRWCGAGWGCGHAAR